MKLDVDDTPCNPVPSPMSCMPTKAFLDPYRPHDSPGSDCPLPNQSDLFEVVSNYANNPGSADCVLNFRHGPDIPPTCPSFDQNTPSLPAKIDQVGFAPDLPMGEQQKMIKP